MKKLYPMAVAALLLGLAALAATPALSQGRDDNEQASRPLDLTRIAPDDAPAPDPANPGSRSGNRSQIVVSTGLRATSPSSLQLASLGLDIPDLDGLGRLMWGTTDADKVVALYGLLPEVTTSAALQKRLEHIMLSRAVPPGGKLSHAEPMVNLRLNWLRSQGKAENLAALVRQLPDQEPWLEWKKWLALHDLINRNDDEGCRYAADQVLTTLDNVWHQINAFCQVISGDISQASFGLDILADRGVDDPTYFTLMEYLTGDRADAKLPEDAAIGSFNLVLMDSARVEISSAALQTVQGHRNSLWGLRYLGDDAQILLGARLFNQPDLAVGEVVADWSVLPIANVPVSEALTRLSVAETDDEISLARFLAWQAIALEQDREEASELALRALSYDYDHAGGRSLELWSSFIRNDESTTILKALLPGEDATAFSAEALAWTHIASSSPEMVEADHLILAGAVDAIPLLEAQGRRVAKLEWQDQIGSRRPLAPGKASLRFGHLLALESAAASKNKAETLLMAAVALGPAKPWHLGRDDAARMVAALRRAGFEDASRGLAREILMGWVLERHFGRPEGDRPEGDGSGEADAAAG